LVSGIKGGTQTEISDTGWKELHNEELHNFYSSPSKIRMLETRGMRWGGHVAQMGEEEFI
jgi:hypothetical protein